MESPYLHSWVGGQGEGGAGFASATLTRFVFDVKAPERGFAPGTEFWLCVPADSLVTPACAPNGELRVGCRVLVSHCLHLSYQLTGGKGPGWRAWRHRKNKLLWLSWDLPSSVFLMPRVGIFIVFQSTLSCGKLGRGRCGCPGDNAWQALPRTLCTCVGLGVHPGPVPDVQVLNGFIREE